jgi:hypothetical protein
MWRKTHNIPGADPSSRPVHLLQHTKSPLFLKKKNNNNKDKMEIL